MSNRRPSLQFYPADYAANTNLRRCTHEEKGVNMDFLCLAHDSDEYGVIRWPLSDLARAIGCKPSVLESLVSKNVIKGADAGAQCEAFTFTPYHAGQHGVPVALVQAQPGPIWYSSRMVRDEYVRKNRGRDTQFTGPDDPSPKGTPKPQPKVGIGGRFGDGPSSPSSSSKKEKPPTAPGGNVGTCTPPRVGWDVPPPLEADPPASEETFEEVKRILANASAKIGERSASVDGMAQLIRPYTPEQVAESIESERRAIRDAAAPTGDPETPPHTTEHPFTPPDPAAIREALERDRTGPHPDWVRKPHRGAA